MATDHSIEVWLPVVEFPEHYEVSNLGRIRSFRRYHGGVMKGQRIWYGGKILKPNQNGHGYYQVPLSIGRVRHMRRIHSLVLIAFVGPAPFDGAVCNHKDGCRTNNRVENLEWVTQAENVRHAINVLGHISLVPSQLTNAQAVEAVALRAAGWTIDAVAEKFGVTHACVQKRTAGCGYENMPKGEDNPSAKLTKELVRRVRQMRAAGLSAAKIAATLGFGKSTIKRVISGETWSHVV